MATCTLGNCMHSFCFHTALCLFNCVVFWSSLEHLLLWPCPSNNEWFFLFIIWCSQLLNLNLSGTLAPELGQLSQLRILWVASSHYDSWFHLFSQGFSWSSFKLLTCRWFFCSFGRDFMWNELSGTIPKEIGNMTSLTLL